MANVLISLIKMVDGTLLTFVFTYLWHILCIYLCLFISAEFRSERSLQYKCFTCNFTSDHPRRMSLENRQCRYCRLSFHQTPELCVHLMMEHGKTFKPLINPMVCQLCVGKPFETHEPEPFCQHRYKEHHVCLVHLICGNLLCSVLMPSEQALAEHIATNGCKSLYGNELPTTSASSTSAPLAIRKLIQFVCKVFLHIVYLFYLHACIFIYFSRVPSSAETFAVPSSEFHVFYVQVHVQ